jgi:hypothetical protein
MNAPEIEKLNDIREKLALLYAELFPKALEFKLTGVLKELVALSQDLDRLYLEIDEKAQKRTNGKKRPN